MNCQNCGQTLGEVQNGQVQCSGCQTVYVFMVPQVSIDGITPSEAVSDCLCPRCRVPLSCGFHREDEVEYCQTCHGILFDQPAFGMIVDRLRREYRGTDEHPHPIDQHQLAVRRPCPVCDATMECHPYYGPGNAVIDTCADCKVVWLDAGELTLLQRAPGARS